MTGAPRQLAAALAVPLLMMSWMLAACGAGPSAELAAAQGFRTELQSTMAVDAPVSGTTMDWRTSWRLTWEPVPGAAGYLVYYRTSEGPVDRPPTRRVPTTEVSVEAAAGTSSAERLDRDRGATLAMTAAQLSVAVAPVGTDGAEGPRSPWFAVGQVLDATS